MSSGTIRSIRKRANGLESLSKRLASPIVDAEAIEIEGQRINCFNGGPKFSFSQGISLMVNAETQEEIDHLYESLSEGGKQEPCSWLDDKFGVSWQIVPPILGKLLGDPDREKAGRVMNAMFKMTK